MKKIALLLSAFFLVACAASKVPPPKSAATYFQEGEKFFELGLYEDAIASWEKVRDSFYSSDLNALAELKIAEAHALAGNYPEAAAAYDSFLKQHPGHEKTAHATFQMGMAHYHQMLSADRDQTASRNALATFESLLKRYPDFAEAEEAKRLIALARNRLAEHELYVGWFYLRYDQPQAAIRRLQGVFTEYPEFQGKDEAYFLLGRAYLMEGQRQEAAQAFNTLYRDYPDSRYVPEAQKIIAKSY